MRSKKAFLNIVTNFLLEFAFIVNGLVVPKIIISHYGSNVNGLLSSIVQFLGYISLLEAGIGPVIRASLYKPLAKKDKNEVMTILKASEKFFRVIAIIFVIYIVGLAFLYPVFVNKNFDYWYIFILIIIISLSTFAEYFFGMTYKMLLQSDQKKYVISTIQAVTYVLNIILVLVISKFDVSIHFLKMVTALAYIIRPLFLNFYVKRKYNFDLKNVSSDYKIKNKNDGLVQHIAASVHEKTDITLLTFFSTLSEISVYSVYYLIVKAVKSIIQSFNGGIDSLFGDMLAKNEKENLNKKFGLYEITYFTICTIICSCSITLITPFVMVYTKGVTDANYIRYTFGYLIVISEYIWAIRLPYNSLVLAAGHFKQTKIGACVEAAVNIIVSIILLNKYGIIGVAIGTTVAMTIRTIEFIYYTNKNILHRNIFISIKIVSLIILETIICVFISKYLIIFNNITYWNWILNAIIVLIVYSIIILSINYIFYGKEFKEMFLIIKRAIFSKRNFVKKCNKQN